MIGPGLDRRIVAARFEQAAAGYDDAAAVHHEVGERLREHLDPVRIEPALVLDVGTGSGRCAAALSRRYRGARVVAIDRSAGMLRVARTRRPWWSRRIQFLTADAGGLPLASGRADLVYSNLALHWCADLAGPLGEMARVAAPGALLALSTFGPDTHRELREAWAAVDDEPHVHLLPDMHDVGDAILRAGFGGIVMESERIEVTYPDLSRLHAELRAQGAVNAAADRRRSLTGRRRGAAFESALRRASGGDGRLRLTYEVVYAHAWKPLANDPVVPVESLIRRRLG